MVALVNHNTWDVADAATDHLQAITSILDSEQLSPVEHAFRDIVGPRFARLSDNDDAGTALLRQRMQRSLVVAAKEQEMREPLAAAAAARIGRAFARRPGDQSGSARTIRQSARMPCPP